MKHTGFAPQRPSEGKAARRLKTVPFDCRNCPQPSAGSYQLHSYLGSWGSHRLEEKGAINRCLERGGGKCLSIANWQKANRTIGQSSLALAQQVTPVAISAALPSLISTRIDLPILFMYLLIGKGSGIFRTVFHLLNVPRRLKYFLMLKSQQIFDACL